MVPAARSAPRALLREFPPSPPCGCPVCRSYCRRPGWWTVEEARLALEEGWGPRMMLELSPDRSFGVLSPAFRGNEGFYALKAFSGNGCTFLDGGTCALHGSPFMPLECRFCHHDRPGEGPRCHAALEREWNTARGQRLVRGWAATFCSRASGVGIPVRR